MKNLVLATILISLSGTTLSATVDTTGHPPEMADKLANPKATAPTKSTTSTSPTAETKSAMTERKK
jgi:hypothetical protein